MVIISIRSSVDGLVQECSNPIANAMELLQSCTEPDMNTAATTD